MPDSPRRYAVLRRNIVLATVVGAIIPLFAMAFVNYQATRTMAKRDAIEPMRNLLNKTQHSFDLFLAERRSSVSYLAAAYSIQELSDQETMERIFGVLKEEFGGFVDLGLIGPDGIQRSYAGPYGLVGKDYSAQNWLAEVGQQGAFISDVLLGYRQYPHFAIAVRHDSPEGEAWTVRTTLDTETFHQLIGAMDLEPGSDAFLVNRGGVLQTESRHYGQVLDEAPFQNVEGGPMAGPAERIDPMGHEVLVGSVGLDSVPLTLVLVKPRVEVLRSWYSLQNQLLIFLIVSVVVILAVSFRFAIAVTRHIERSELREREALQVSEHANKLASIGRLAAGVAHEINNPTAIVDQKAGLMQDLMELGEDFPQKARFQELTESILKSVDRVRTITHRLLGFARRMDVEMEEVDINELIVEVLGFLEREAANRGIEVELELNRDLPRIYADAGQLEQVFLNILTNAFLAVDDGGRVTVKSESSREGHLAVTFTDDGAGMSTETLEHIFEPFFTTRKGSGTGLGLSISYGIIKRLGGEIEVESEERRGATFRIHLPIESRPDEIA